jgi:hypothetical protein
MAHKLVSKAEAKKRGLPTYNDTPCRKCGHSERYTNSGKCINCHAERNKRRPKKGKPGNKAVSRAAPALAGAGLVPINSEPLTGEVISGDWRFYADRITATWQNAVQNIVEAGRLLIEAKGKVEHGDWLKLVEELPFGERRAQRLMEIARHPTHGSFLPPSWRTLYELSRLDEPVPKNGA